MKHTPGKWYAEPKDGYFKVIEGGDPDCQHCTSDIMIAAEVTKEDALLIAAAPDLLAALKTCEDWLSFQMTEEERLAHDRIGHAAHTCILCSARAAIAKTEGDKG